MLNAYFALRELIEQIESQVNRSSLYIVTRCVHFGAQCKWETSHWKRLDKEEIVTYRALETEGQFEQKLMI